MLRPPIPRLRPGIPQQRPPSPGPPAWAARPLLLILALLATGCAPEPLPTALGATLISVDTLRADRLGAWGHARDTSPGLDRLAADGVRFEECFSPTSWTLPAHLSMLTGLAISVHGVDDERLWNVVGQPGAPSSVPLRGTFLPELLEAEGFRTAGFYSWKYLEPRFGFGRGFETYEREGRSIYDDPKLYQRYQALRDAGEEDEIAVWRAAAPELFQFDEPRDDRLVDRGLGWLDDLLAEAGGDTAQLAPFFLFLHLFDPHDSYVPPPPFDAAFTDPDYAGPVTGREIVNLRLIGDSLRPADLEQLNALYEGEIAWCDSQIQRFVEGLEVRGLANDTILSVTSDHGEEFFEHGSITHRANVYRETTHVPWILHWPAGLKRARVVSGPVGVVDIAPTLLGLLGLDVPSDLSGRDLTATARGLEPNASHPYTSLVQIFQGDYSPARHTVLRRDGLEFYQAFENGKRTQLALFERSEPDGELVGRDLQPDDPAALAMLAELEELKDEYRRQRAVARPRATQGGRLSAAELAELEALGYASAGEQGATGSSIERLAIDGGIWPDR